MNEYEAKIAARKERMEARAVRMESAAQATYKRAKDLASVIPFGQPILVGHHSEGRDRNYRAKIGRTYDKAFETHRAAQNLASRAESVGTGGISSDDPGAIKKLKKELADKTERQAMMKAENAKFAADGNKAGRQADGTWIDPPNPPHHLSNNNANMSRIKKRIAALERLAAAREANPEPKTTTHESGAKIVENIEANRLQIVFEGKPAADVRTKLKSYGFRWAPSENAWQRQLSNGARHAAECVLRDAAI